MSRIDTLIDQGASFQDLVEVSLAEAPKRRKKKAPFSQRAGEFIGRNVPGIAGVGALAAGVGGLAYLAHRQRNQPYPRRILRYRPVPSQPFFSQRPLWTR